MIHARVEDGHEFVDTVGRCGIQLRMFSNSLPEGPHVFERDVNGDGKLWGERPCFAVLLRVVIACMGGLQGKVVVYNDLVRGPASLRRDRRIDKGSGI